MIFIKILARIIIVLLFAGFASVLLNAQPTDEIDLRVNFLQDGFDNEPGIRPFSCMSGSGDRGCYRLVLRMPENFGAKFSSKMLSATYPIDLELETIRQGGNFVYLTMPTTGGTLTFYAQQKDNISVQHIFPPDEPGITLHYEIEITLRQQQVEPKGVILDGSNRTRRSLRGRSRIQHTESETVQKKNSDRELGQSSQPDNEVYEAVDQDPVLIEGFEALQGRVDYPEAAKEAGIEGMVHIEFIINEQGEVVEPNVVRSLSEETDKEALRVIAETKFEPGILNGQPVKVYYSLPIYFRLSE